MIEIIEKYFQDNPEWLISHQLDSYHDFIFDKVKYIIKTLQEEFTIIETNETNKQEHFKTELFVGGIDNEKIYLSKPTIKDGNIIRPLYPNEARLKDITYAVDLYADIYIRATYYQSKQELKKKGVELKDEIVKEFTREKVKLCAIPIMVKSKMCSLYKQPANILTELGECPYDKGGYFIINGKEKVIVSQESLVTNRIFVNKVNGGTEIEKYKYRAQVRNTEEDNTLFPKVIKFYIYNDIYQEGKKHNAITVMLPVKSKIDVKNADGDKKDLESVNKEVPLCVLFRALGIESDKDIAKYILMNDDLDESLNSQLVNFLEPTFYDGSTLYTQMEALNYLQQFTQFNKYDDENEAEKFDLVAIQNILIHEIFPNVGSNFKEKAFILGYYVNIFIKTVLGMYKESERDNYMHKRVNVPGNMMISIFRDFYNKFRIQYRLEMNTTYAKKAIKTLDDIELLFNEKNIYKVLKTYEITDKILKSFKGDWGLLDASPENAEAKRQRQGYVQDLNRLSYVGTLCHLRRVRTPMNTDIKIVEPHKLHPSQWGVLCPSESPDGGNIGIIKHLAMTAYITGSADLQGMKKCLTDHGLIPLSMLHINNMTNLTKILINDTWVGIHKDPYTLLQKLRLLKRNAIISIFTGLSWNIYRNELNIRIDNGRCVRPLFIVEHGELLIKRGGTFDENMKKTWFELIKGTTISDEEFDIIEHSKTYRDDLLGTDYDFEKYDISSGMDKKLYENGCVIEYIDIEDANYHVIAMHETDLIDKSHINFTYCEIHPSLALSVYTNTIPFSHHNAGTRNVFSGAQGKQALGMYATNFNQRLDTSGYILHYPQKSLVNNKYDVYTNMDMLPNGQNLIVAIMTYSGYNQEDAVIFNRKAIERGCHNVTGYSLYDDEEAIDNKRKVKKLFGNTKTLQGFNSFDIKKADYSTIDELGFPIENTYINDKSVILGKYIEEEVNYSMAQKSGSLFNQYQSGVTSKKYRDDSKLGSRLIYGHIDKVYKYIKSTGEKKVKIRMRNFKMPRLGDKLGCFKEDTEVLTVEGWKKIIDVKLEDKVAILDNDNVKYENPSQLHEYNYEGKLYELKSQLVDLTVTPNHKMYIKKRNAKEFGLFEAQDIFGKRVNYKKNINNFVPENWIGNKFVIPSYTEKTRSKKERNEIIVNMNDWLTFFGIWIAEGYVDGNNTVIATNKLRVREELDKVIPNMGFKICKRVNGNTYTICDIQVADYMKQFSVGALHKFLPEWTWKLNKEQCQLLLKSMELGDGHTEKSNTRHYYTSSKQLCEDVSRLALHAGYSTYVRVPKGKEAGMQVQFKERDGSLRLVTTTADNYSITIIKNKNEPQVNHGHTLTQNGQTENWIDFVGKVYCLTVRTGVFLVRQNGKPVWSGNSKHGQKGVCGMILEEEDMPYNKDGVVPDIIINPHAIPTRMTIGHMLETVFAKLAALSGRFIDGTAFNSKYYDKLFDNLEDYGYNKHGDELLYNGKTGEQQQGTIFFGPIFYYKLKHMVGDKINWRGGSKMLLPDGGKVSSLTRQPPHGRSSDGGLRMGEMEVNAVLSHGVGSFMKESMFDRADLYTMLINNEDGYIPTYNLEKSKLYNYGNNVSQIFLPYTYKLMTHEAQALGIKQRFITNNTSYYNENVKPIEVYNEKNDLVEEYNEIEDEKEINKMD